LSNPKPIVNPTSIAQTSCKTGIHIAITKHVGIKITTIASNGIKRTQQKKKMNRKNSIPMSNGLPIT